MSNNSFYERKWKYVSISLMAVLAVGFSFPQASAHVSSNVQHMLEHIFSTTNDTNQKVTNIESVVTASKCDADLVPHGDYSGCDFSNRDLSGLNLSFANLSGANLENANLSGANLNFANLSGANLSDANLSGSSLAGANLSGSSLADANLSGAFLFNANLENALLIGADITGSNWTEANTFECYGCP